MSDLKKKQYFYLAVYISLTIITIIRLFYKLGAEVLNATDEAWYATNTCEMFINHNWLVPTLRGQVDYGSKPPLSLLLNLICYSIFGINEFAFRLSSAVSGLAIYFLISLFLYKKYDARYAIIVAAVFPILRSCFDFHMFRAGDMDALFCLLYILAIYSLYELKNGNEKMLILYAVTIGLAFFTKSMHAVLFAAVGVFYLSFIYKNIKLRNVLIGAVGAILPTLIWVIARYPFDGIRFIYSISIGETHDKVDAAFSFDYIRFVLTEPVTLLMLAVLFLRIVYYFAENRQNITAKRTFGDFLAYMKERYLTVVAYIMPIAIYSAAGSFLSWYIYPSFIVSIWIIAIEAGTLLDKLDNRAIGYVFSYGIVLACVFYSCVQISQYRLLGTTGHALEEFREDITSYREQNQDRYEGANAYCAYDRHRQYGETGHWENTFTFYAESIGGFRCIDGGVEAFLEDENSVIIMDGELWDTYAGDLTGFVFLEQNTFYVLCHERY